VAQHAEILKESAREIRGYVHLQEPPPESLRRPWEGSQQQFIQWAANRATELARQGRGSDEGGQMVLTDMLEAKENVGSVERMKNVLNNASTNDSEEVDAMDESDP
jgi:hypothetical protein